MLELGAVADRAEIRVVAVLLAPLGVAARRLDVAVGVRADPDVGIGRRDRQRADAGEGLRVPHRLAPGVAIGEARPALPTRQARHGVVDVAQARLLGGVARVGDRALFVARRGHAGPVPAVSGSPSTGCRAMPCSAMPCSAMPPRSGRACYIPSDGYPRFRRRTPAPRPPRPRRCGLRGPLPAPRGGGPGRRAVGDGGDAGRRPSRGDRGGGRPGGALRAGDLAAQPDGGGLRGGPARRHPQGAGGRPPPRHRPPGDRGRRHGRRDVGDRGADLPARRPRGPERPHGRRRAPDALRACARRCGAPSPPGPPATSARPRPRPPPWGSTRPIRRWRWRARTGSRPPPARSTASSPGHDHARWRPPERP